MKKILFLAATLCGMINSLVAVADVHKVNDFAGLSSAPVEGEWAADTQWFIVQNINENSKQEFYLSPTASFLPSTLPTVETLSNYLWAFVQTENGICMYNKATGTDKVLGVSGSTSSMVSLNDVSKNSCWDLYTSLDEGKFLILVAGSEHNALNNNQQKGVLCLWDSEGALYGWNHTAANPAPKGDGGSNFAFIAPENYEVVVDGPAEGGIIIDGVTYHNGDVAKAYSSLVENYQAQEIEGYNCYKKVEGSKIVVTYVAIQDFPVNFDPTKVYTTQIGAERHVKNFAIDEEAYDLSEDLLTYRDLTSVTYTVAPGASVQPAALICTGDNKAWLHGYLYLNTVDDKDFTVDEYQIYEATSLSTSAAVDFRSFAPFTAPATEGSYRMRLKLDWNNNDPKGGSDIIAGNTCGSVIDFTLIVSATEGVRELTTDNGQRTTDRVYDLQGRSVNTAVRGLYIQNGSKVLR